jgi:uncharacterized membrane protein
MLEYIFLLRGNQSFHVPGLENPSITVRLAILNGFFLFLYVTRRIIVASPTSAGLALFGLLVVLGANLFVAFQPDIVSLLETLTNHF